ncbi:MAG: ribonuclease HI family protein [Phycisphaerae bacterium]
MRSHSGHGSFLIGISIITHSRVIAYFDGGARGNPGPAGAGVSICGEDHKPIFEAGFYLGQKTNNAAEYNGLLFALQYAAELLAESIELRSDSELVVRQVTGDYRVKSPILAPLYEQAQRRLLQFRGWTIRHIPREANGRADELANLAMDRRKSVVVLDVAKIGAERPDCDEPDSTGLPGSQSAQKGSAGSTPARHSTLTSVQVSVTGVPEDGRCFAGTPFAGERLTLTQTFPAQTCLYAANALAPTILAMLKTDAAEAANLPVMSVRCANSACRTLFCVSPQLKGNGASNRKQG